MNKKCFMVLTITLIAVFCHGGNMSRDLLQTELKENGYLISVSANYEVEINNGEDFIVYYLNDKSQKAANGGIYFGNHPSKFYKQKDKIETIKSPFLNGQKSWNVYYDKDEKLYLAEIITNNIGGKEWERSIHAFGSAKSIEEIKELLFLFSTMARKSKTD